MESKPISIACKQAEMDSCTSGLLHLKLNNLAAISLKIPVSMSAVNR